MCISCHFNINWFSFNSLPTDSKCVMTDQNKQMDQRAKVHRPKESLKHPEYSYQAHKIVQGWGYWSKLPICHMASLKIWVKCLEEALDITEQVMVIIITVKLHESREVSIQQRKISTQCYHWNTNTRGFEFLWQEAWRTSHTTGRADSRLAPSQRETSLQSNTASHWLGANLNQHMLGGSDAFFVARLNPLTK